ncbi:hypothetical protein V494_06368, partial [Pseudogymnoascus sp. VKM F-4513 (FW-928)]
MSSGATDDDPARAVPEPLPWAEPDAGALVPTARRGRVCAAGRGGGIYFHLNHPVKWVRLTGIIVAMDEFYNRVCITIDDGSGATIEATCLAPPRPEPSATVAAIAISTDRPADDAMVSPDGPKLRSIDIGKVVKVKGGIKEFRGVRQVAMKAIA